MESKGKAAAAVEAVSLRPMVAAIPGATRWQAKRAVVLREWADALATPVCPRLVLTSGQWRRCSWGDGLMMISWMHYRNLIGGWVPLQKIAGPM